MDDKKRNRIRDLKERLNSLFSRYPEDAPVAIREEMATLISELKGLTDDADVLRVDRWMNAPAGPGPRQPGGGGSAAPYGGKSLGEIFVSSRAYRDYDPGTRQGPSAEIEIKALLSTVEMPPDVRRMERIEGYPHAPLSVIGAFPPGETTESSVNYLEETTSTSGAVEVTEGDTKGESTIVFTPRVAPVETIATWIPVSQQLMSDVAACRSFVGERLARFVRARLDGQLLNGDGAAPNLRGLLNVVGVQTQAKGADPTPDAILKAITLATVGDYRPSHLFIHPNDWLEVRLLRTADGLYIFGHPSDTDKGRCWGLQVVSTTGIPEGTGLVGDCTLAAQPLFRQNMTVNVSDSHSDYFVKNLLALRAEIRVGFPVFRPSAWCMITGI